MTTLNQIITYVADAQASAALYTSILGQKPIEQSPNFAMFALPSGAILGLWNRQEVEPRATLPGGTELGFPVETDEAVTATRNEWAGLGLRILQEPTAMDFGFTCTAADPDGHRLRVFHPAG